MRLNMRAERVRRGLRAADAARAVGVHQNALLRWERGVCEPRPSSLFKLARLYGCTPEYLMEEAPRAGQDARAGR